MTKNDKARAVSAAALAAIAAGLIAVAEAQQPVGRGTVGPPAPNAWVTAWGTSQQALGETAISNATVRLIARVTIPGEAVRVRLDNGYGTEPLRVGRATIAPRIQGALVAPGSMKPLTFGKSTEATIPPGGAVWSDPVPMPVFAQQDLAVTLFIPGNDVKPSQHTNGVVTSYRTPNGAGDKTSDESRTPFTETFTATWWLKSIDVQSSVAGGAIVAFGDSITDGTCSTLEANDRWVNVLSTRLGLQYEAVAAQAGSRARVKAIVNEGIGGNTVTRNVQPAPDSMPGLERFDRDVLSHHSVTDVIVFMGTNDLRREGSVSQVTDGLATIVKRVKAAGPRVIGVTMIPRHNVEPTATNTGWNSEKTRRRREVNEWIRTKAGFDAVLDFDAMVRDKAQPDLIHPPFNCGDGIHPSPAGYLAIGKAIPLSLFDAPRGTR